MAQQGGTAMQDEPKKRIGRFTHEGTIKGADARTPKGYQLRSALRETKLYWVTTEGIQFRKVDGFTPGDWGLYRLDLDSVTPLSKGRNSDEGNG
jgi:hypothetical protein